MDERQDVCIQASARAHPHHYAHRSSLVHVIWDESTHKHTKSQSFFFPSSSSSSSFYFFIELDGWEGGRVYAIISFLTLSAMCPTT